MWGPLVIAALALLGGVVGNIVVFMEQPPHTIMEEFRDLPAAFGPELDSNGVRGLLAVGSPPDGCETMSPPPSAANYTGYWIVIVARYNCNFETKVRNAQAAGFDCVIVHNVNSSDLDTMSAKNQDGIDIPSVFVSDLAGKILSENYSYNTNTGLLYFVMVNGDPPFDINTHLLLPFAIVVALCLLIMILFMVVKCIKDRRRARRHRLPARALRKIPTCKFTKGDPYDTCAICLDDYVEGDKLRVLPCAHAYHAKCIDPWLTRNRRVCPVCKRRVVSGGEQQDRSSDSESEREPLLPAHSQQNGTFEAQRENPFQRARRLLARARRPPAPPPAPAPAQEEAVEEENHDPAETTNDVIVVVLPQENETQPLMSSEVMSEPPSRGRRSRRARPVRSDRLSINSAEERGSIGVAALPAPPRDNYSPHVLL